MFRAKTVLVVGAGASTEVGLPMGHDLLKRLVKLTHITFEYHRQKTGDPEIVEALRIILNEGQEVEIINQYIKAGWQLSESSKQAISIDNVIDALEDDKIELIGKLGILRSIHKAEFESQAFRCESPDKDDINIENFEQSWYSSLTKLLTEGVKRSDIGKIFQNIEIINFNYDRCLEHYLPISLGKYYGISPNDFRRIMNSLVIHRPYGVAGRLPWQKGDLPSVPFGQCSPAHLAQVVQQIRTFTERVEEGAVLSEIKKSISQSDRIIFLGFAFHRQNVQILSQEVQDHTEVVATAYGISKSDKFVIANELSKAFNFQGNFNEHRIDLADMTCHQFFKEYWLTLTAGVQM
ncbi:hypothetical protein [uncultured Sphingosinicella sp.]|uniref:hypothetical protein n=1 Tax=uncultured Sphingosinicella sp. TaxID=478748 RepID=UPI0030DC4329